jgi:hypothetical protein
MRPREWFIVETKFAPDEAFRNPGPGRFHVREVLPDHVTISRDQFWDACKKIMNEADPGQEFSLVDLDEMLFDPPLVSHENTRCEHSGVAIDKVKPK